MGRTALVIVGYIALAAGLVLGGMPLQVAGLAAIIFGLWA